MGRDNMINYNILSIFNVYTLASGGGNRDISNL